jgi:hypothetical protein
MTRLLPLRTPSEHPVDRRQRKGVLSRSMPSAGCRFIRIAILLLVSAVAVRATRAESRVIAAEPPTPALLLLDAHYLDEVRTRLAKGDQQLEAALASLEQDARKALAVTPPSVMDKTVLPPSGDKHDYMSQAPYWWPDPNQPDGLPYIRRDGERNPEIQGISDRANLGFVSSAVPTLALAFHLTGQSQYATHAARLVQAWFLDTKTRMSPHLRFGQGIPGITAGRGIGIIETRELPELLDGVTLLAGSPAWTKADQQGLEGWMRAYLEWLRNSPHGRAESRNGNNHETWYDVQVASLALFTGQRALAKRTLVGAQDRIARQVAPDGRQPRELERTRSWHYSIFNLRAFFCLATLGERVGVDLWRYRTRDGRSVRRALDFLVPYAAAEHRWPYEQITPFGADTLAGLLRRAATVWSEPTYAQLAQQVGGEGDRLKLTTP